MLVTNQFTSSSEKMQRESPNLCRYFANGCCTRAEACQFSHDRSSKPDMICAFYLKGSCLYDSACRFDHIKPKKEKKEIPTKSHSLPKPVRLPKAGLNVAAAEFVPSWKRAEAGTSYSQVVGTSSTVCEKDIPLCPYFEMGECLVDNCTLIHGDVCEMCSTACLHPYDEEQKKAHFNECLITHHRAMEQAFAEAKSKEKQCGICMDNVFEKSSRFGILEGCKHCFCLDCIRQWRKKQEFETKVVRSCPECRVHSDYVVPSLYWVEEDDEKTVLVELYKENTKEKLCKYYMNKSSDGCPFGNKCFYKHQMPDGAIDPGTSPHVRRRPQLSGFLFRESDFSDDDYDDVDSDDMVERLIAALQPRLGLGD
ncbi:unnamed protein product [Auanema sp. JU1783]|nr:unnamed protein product [Auanema sp. JU1783]